MAEASSRCLSFYHERASSRKRKQPKPYKLDMVMEEESYVVGWLLSALLSIVFAVCFALIMFALYPQNFKELNSGVVQVIMENAMKITVGLGVCLVGAGRLVPKLEHRVSYKGRYGEGRNLHNMLQQEGFHRKKLM